MGYARTMGTEINYCREGGRTSPTVSVPGALYGFVPCVEASGAVREAVVHPAQPSARSPEELWVSCVPCVGPASLT